MATGTLAPEPRMLVLNASGAPISGAKLLTYLAGTSTPAATYSDVTLLTANANPVLSDGSGRIGPIFLSPGTSYKFVLNNPDNSNIWTQDNISSVPGSGSGIDITGVAGEALTAGQVVYLSDGSGSKTAGLWYKADSANTYSSTTPEIGMVPASIASGASGTIRLGGVVTGLSSLTVGTTYYVGTAGALTATAPVNRRVVGVADTTSSIVLGNIPAVPLANNAVCDGRLTLTTGVPVTTADVTAATTLYFTPYRGNTIALFNGTSWDLIAFSQLSIAVPATTLTMYDAYVYNNSGTATLELTAWTNVTTRATALVTQDGVLSKTGALTRRYVGSFLTTGVSGQTESSFTKRFVWNYYNRVPLILRRVESTDSWAYTVLTWRQANASGSNQVEMVLGVAEVEISLDVQALCDGGGGAIYQFVAVGEDSVTAPTVPQIIIPDAAGNSIKNGRPAGHLKKYPTVGYHYYAWLEKSTATSVTTWYGDDGDNTSTQSGIQGEMLG